jgi:hypothetical protein
MGPLSCVRLLHWPASDNTRAHCAKRGRSCDRCCGVAGSLASSTTRSCVPARWEPSWLTFGLLAGSSRCLARSRFACASCLASWHRQAWVDVRPRDATLSACGMRVAVLACVALEGITLARRAPADGRASRRGSRLKLSVTGDSTTLGGHGDDRFRTRLKHHADHQNPQPAPVS